MKKIKVKVEEIREKILEFYDEKVWHFITLNGVGLDENRAEVQWIFSKYDAMEEIVLFYCEVDYDVVIPSVVDIIPSAIISQRELVDLFGIAVEGSSSGLYLDKDSPQMPLRSCGCKL